MVGRSLETHHSVPQTVQDEQTLGAQTSFSSTSVMETEDGDGPFEVTLTCLQLQEYYSIEEDT